jgi:hypothetical protein
MCGHAVVDRASVPNVVRLGGVEKPALLQGLRAHKIQLNRAADMLFEDHRFVPLDQRHVVEIAMVSVAEVGFSEGATYAKLVARALESGLVECPLELGPHLRIQFLDQSEGAAALTATHGRVPPGAITVASSPLDERDETPKGFYLRRIDGVLWLRGYWSWPGHVWSPEDILVFARIQSLAESS